MAQSKNLLLANVRGRIGDYVVRQVGGKTVISRRPRFVGRPTPLQRERQNRFKKANEYANQVQADPVLSKLYARGIKGNLTSVRPLAIRDYLKAPVIHDIDLEEYDGANGSQITINAQDDFMVTRVQVCLLSGGVAFETGEAVREPRSKCFWTYTATTAAPGGDITIQVTAFDTPGNETKLHKTIAAVHLTSKGDEKSKKLRL